MKILKIAALLMAACLCLSLASCAAIPDLSDCKTTDTSDKTQHQEPPADVPNVDGEIGGWGEYSEGKFALAKEGGWYDASYGTPYDRTGEYPVATGSASGGEIAAPGGPGGVIIYPDGQGEYYAAGTLTAGEWRDNHSWADWLSKLAGKEWQGITEAWLLRVGSRVSVAVTSGAEPVKGASVALCDDAGNVLWRAVTDYEGRAYLFWDEKNASSSPNYPDAGRPKSVTVTAPGAEPVSLAYNGEEELSVAVNTATPAPVAKKLDLMFVVDTTGSMSDELEYLKAELKDVVTRAASASGAVVRTSVNFYRDEGDEYVVRYFGFKDDVNEAVANISAQRAMGGGDYPEAVHTALYNAIFEHAWDDGDSVKLLFLVLDAPPHDDPQVKESLKASIEAAAARGIRIIPVLSSGTDTTCEVLYRSFAAMTGGTYAFLTDHSGIGNPHTEQNVGEFTVEKLNDLMVRIITQFCS